MVNPAISHGIPAFLIKKGGLNSGFMIVQYSAAALVSENKVLSHPASVDSIPSSANQEDHVSMGTIAARKARTILQQTQEILAMETLAACQAIDLQEEFVHLGKGTLLAYNHIRKYVDFIEEDTVMYPYIHKVNELISSGLLVDTVCETMYLQEV